MLSRNLARDSRLKEIRYDDLMRNSERLISDSRVLIQQSHAIVARCRAVMGLSKTVLAMRPMNRGQYGSNNRRAAYKASGA
jgi:hypothetical protein